MRRFFLATALIVGLGAAGVVVAQTMVAPAFADCPNQNC
jgi:hypothetical protein